MAVCWWRKRRNSSTSSWGNRYLRIDSLQVKVDNRLLFTKSLTEFQGTDTVANSPQARKRARQAENRRQRNAGQRSMMRTSVKKVVYAIQDGNKDDAESAYKAAVPVLDAAARKGLIHKNKAARYKSRLNEQIRAL